MRLHFSSPIARQKKSARRIGAQSLSRLLTVISEGAILTVAKPSEKGFRNAVSGAFFFCGYCVSCFDPICRYSSYRRSRLLERYSPKLEASCAFSASVNERPVAFVTTFTEFSARAQFRSVGRTTLDFRAFVLTAASKISAKRCSWGASTKPAELTRSTAAAALEG